MSATAAPSSAATVTVRPFTATDADYAAVMEVHAAVWPDYPDTPEQYRFQDERRDPKTKWGRVLAECGGRVVGCGSWGQQADMFHPRKFDVGVDVLPEWEGQGIGTALYEAVLENIAAHDPILLRCHAREDRARGVRFLRDRGFEEEMRDWESRLDLTAFDPAPFAGAEERVAAQGIAIKTLAELADDPDRDRKLFELDWAVTLDMPSPDTLTQPTFEHWSRNVFENPNFLPEAWFIALDGDRYVGESALWKSQGNSDLSVGATGVLREYRRRGIAMTLKLRACAYAKAAGTPQIKTWNAQTNRAMLSINEALGFVKQPAWISFARKLKDEDA
jgi:GNAT superfamily N-acetyltransferase